MAFLHKLWDETVAGPIPDDGVGRQIEKVQFILRRATTTTGTALGVQVPPPNDDRPVSRSNAAANNRNLTVCVESVLPSGSSTTTPTSPFSPSGNFKKKLTRRKTTSAAFSGSRDYDWIMLSALDR